MGDEAVARAVEPIEGEFEANPRDLFVYVDGELVARVASRGDLLRRETPSFEVALESGEHTLRITRERHTSRRHELSDRLAVAHRLSRLLHPFERFPKDFQ